MSRSIERQLARIESSVNGSPQLSAVPWWERLLKDAQGNEMAIGIAYFLALNVFSPKPLPAMWAQLEARWLSDPAHWPDERLFSLWAYSTVVCEQTEALEFVDILEEPDYKNHLCLMALLFLRLWQEAPVLLDETGMNAQRAHCVQKDSLMREVICPLLEHAYPATMGFSYATSTLG